MTTVLIVHHPKEDEIARKVAEYLETAGYVAWHQGTVLIGGSIPAEVSELLSQGCPVVLVATERAMGASWTRKIANAVQASNVSRLFALHVEQDADVGAVTFGEIVAEYWRDPSEALKAVVEAISAHYPPDDDTSARAAARDRRLEEKYRQLLFELCDIVDLASLPESDRHIATRQLELRRLYVSLRVAVERRATGNESSDALLSAQDVEQVSQEPSTRSASRRGGRIHAQVVQTESPMLADTEAALDEEPGEGALPEQAMEQVSTAPARAPRPRELSVAHDLQKEQEPRSVGYLLREGCRLVVLGDPGAGKTTLLRWVASAYLLRLKADPDFRRFPDVETLPDTDWLPVLIRCRDLDEDAARGNFLAMLRRSLEKADLDTDEASDLAGLLRRRLQEGRALLLIDGIDEISNPRTRIEFCVQLERSVRAFGAAPVVLTSRIVGYRDLGFSLKGFDHATVAQLRPEDKDAFADHWATLTESPDRASRVADQLKSDIHSSDRIEQLTGNPLLLTTMALVRRKVGRLPNRRVELYREAVELLLRWRSQVEDPIEQREALPQLHFLAYHMCAVGAQRLSRSDTLAVLAQFREEFPNLYEAQAHTPTEFLRLVEARTALLVESGHEKRGAMVEPVYEFRHLTIQEYLAGAALVEEHLPGRANFQNLHDRIRPLAGQTTSTLVQDQLVVVDNWNEALRLCISMAADRDVNEALLAVLAALPNEADNTLRARALLALQVLADEPSGVSASTATVVLDTASRLIGTSDFGFDAVYWAFSELGGSRWGEPAKLSAVAEFRRRAAESNGESSFSLVPARLAVNLTSWLEQPSDPNEWSRLSDDELLEDTFRLIRQGWIDDLGIVRLIRALAHLLSRDAPIDLLSALAAQCVIYDWRWGGRSSLVAAGVPLQQLIDQLKHVAIDPEWLGDVLQLVVECGGRDDELSRQCLGSRWPRVRHLALRGFDRPLAASEFDAVFALFTDPEPFVRAEAVSVAAERAAPNCLVSLLTDTDRDVRIAAIDALAPRATAAELPGMLQSLADKDDGVADEMARCFISRNLPADAVKIAGSLGHRRPAVRRRAAWILGEIKSTDTVEALVACIGDKNREVRCAVARAIGEFGDVRWAPALIALIEDVHADVRAAAVEGIANIPDVDLEIVTPLVDDKSEKVRSLVAWIFADVEPPEEGFAVVSSLKADRSALVRQQVANSFGYLAGRVDFDVREVLNEFLVDRSPFVRSEAFRALVRAGTQAETGDETGENSPARAEVAEMFDGRSGRRMLELLGWIAQMEDPIPDWLNDLVRPQLSDKNQEVRRQSVEVLAKSEDAVNGRLLSRDFDAVPPWIDPSEPIQETTLTMGAARLGLEVHEVRERFQSLAERFGLSLDFAARVAEPTFFTIP